MIKSIKRSIIGHCRKDITKTSTKLRKTSSVGVVFELIESDIVTLLSVGL